MKHESMNNIIRRTFFHLAGRQQDIEMIIILENNPRLSRRAKRAGGDSEVVDLDLDGSAKIANNKNHQLGCHT